MKFIVMIGVICAILFCLKAVLMRRKHNASLPQTGTLTLNLLVVRGWRVQRVTHTQPDSGQKARQDKPLRVLFALVCCSKTVRSDFIKPLMGLFSF